MSTIYPNTTVLKAEIDNTIFDNTLDLVTAANIAARIKDVVDYFDTSTTGQIQFIKLENIDLVATANYTLPFVGTRFIMKSCVVAISALSGVTSLATTFNIGNNASSYNNIAGTSPIGIGTTLNSIVYLLPTFGFTPLLVDITTNKPVLKISSASVATTYKATFIIEAYSY